jgi:hypothetical protein
MAKTMGLAVTVRMKVWVKPLLAVLSFLAPAIWVVGGERSCDWLAEKAPKFVAKHGIRFYVKEI